VASAVILRALSIKLLGIRLRSLVRRIWMGCKGVKGGRRRVMLEGGRRGGGGWRMEGRGILVFGRGVKSVMDLGFFLSFLQFGLLLRIGCSKWVI